MPTQSPTLATFRAKMPGKDASRDFSLNLKGIFFQATWTLLESGRSPKPQMQVVCHSSCAGALKHLLCAWCPQDRSLIGATSTFQLCLMHPVSCCLHMQAIRDAKRPQVLLAQLAHIVINLKRALRKSLLLTFFRTSSLGTASKKCLD